MLISGIFCNVLVCCAVANYQDSKNHFISGFFIMCFVLLGLEHSIANMSYGTIGLLSGIHMYWIKAVESLVIATIGNVIGGRVVHNVVKNNKKGE